MIYLNDVFIYIDKIHENHVKYVYQILQHLLNHDLYIKLKKYEFHIQETQFLNFVISSSDIIMNSEFHDIQMFLEFYNFYHQFINSYSHEILIITILFHKISSAF